MQNDNKNPVHSEICQINDNFQATSCCRGNVIHSYNMHAHIIPANIVDPQITIFTQSYNS